MHRATFLYLISPSPVQADEQRRRAEQLRALRVKPIPASAEIAVRPLSAEDDAEVRRLAERDSSPVPGGPILGAEADGHLIAALSLSTGESIADPFVASSSAIGLLRLRARQLGGTSSPRSRLGRVLRGLGRGRTQAGLAGSPPGAGGRLLQL